MTTDDPQSDDEIGPSSPCRLFVYLAREAAIGVVLRRGPSDWARLSLWRIDTDTFEHGQWMKGRVYERRSDVSPDGSLFVYFARKSGGGPIAQIGQDTWIAISRPPWFTALTLWFIGGTYCAGGCFPDGRTLALGYLDKVPDHGTLPPWLNATTRQRYIDRTADWPDRTIYFNRLLRDGWTVQDDAIASPAPVWQRSSPGGARVLIMAPDRAADFTSYGGRHIDEFAVVDADGENLRTLGQATWADWDQRGRLVIAQNGRLLVDDGGTLRVVEDFNAQSPDPQPSPAEAGEWPPDPGKSGSR